MSNVLKYINSNRASWVAVEDKKLEKRSLSYRSKLEKEKRVKEFRKSDVYKVGLLLASEKRLITKAKRINTLLRKVQKKIKYYNKKETKASSG